MKFGNCVSSGLPPAICLGAYQLLAKSEPLLAAFARVLPQALRGVEAMLGVGAVALIGLDGLFTAYNVKQSYDKYKQNKVTKYQMYHLLAQEIGSLIGYSF